MPRIFKGSESELRLLLSKSQETLTDIKIKLYTTKLEDAIEVIDGIAVENNIATINLAPRAFVAMEDGIINYIVSAKVDGEDYYTERQSNYMLRSLSHIDETGVAETTLNIIENGEYKITPNDGLYVDINVNIEDTNGSYAEGYEDGHAEGYGTGYASGYDNGQIDGIKDFRESLPFLEITENGVYNKENKGVNVNVPTYNVLESDTLKLRAGDTGTYITPEGYDVVKELNYEVLPNRDLRLLFRESGTYRYKNNEPDYSGFAEVTIDVEAPEIEGPIDIELSVGDKGSILPSAGYDGIAQVNYTVLENAGPIKLPNGIRLSGSSLEYFDGSQWDWSNVYDYTFMFKGCSDLREVTNLPVNAKSVEEMFHGCTNLIRVDTTGWKTTGISAINGMFYACANIKSIDLSSLDLSNVIGMYNTFAYCTQLEELRMAGPLTKLRSTDNMFGLILTSGTFYYPAEHDYSKIISQLPSRWTAVPY